VLSLAAAAAGHPEQAIATGDEVGRVGGTYLDQIRAHLGRAFGYARLADDEKARTALASARRIADASEDDFHRALARLAEGVVGSVRGWADASTEEPLEALTKLGVDAQTWERAFRGAAGAEHA
jgi:hypothetical protein